MKIKNRIFISNTVMVLVSLVTLLVITAALVNFNENINTEIAKAKLDENVFEVQSLFEQSSAIVLDYETFSKSLSSYNYQLFVTVDDEKKYSNFEPDDEEETTDFMKVTDLAGDQASVYYRDSLTVVAKSIVIDDHEYNIVAVHNAEHEIEWLGTSFERFIIQFILIGLAAILVILGISQLFTKNLVERIMKPIDQLMDAAKRIEEENLENPIVYAGEDEFVTLCTSFNHMQSYLFEEQKKNATYEKARTDMVSGISHDLRTPLTSVKGYIKGIKDGIANTPEKQNQYLDIAYAKACEMDVLLQRLFYFSKMETGNMPFYLQVTDLFEFIRKFVEGCKNDLETKGASISFDTSGKIHRASIDIEQMQRVLTNLVENSLKYANTGSLEIKISLTQENYREVIVVSDNGGGVDPDKLPHLFEQFYRGDESRSKKNSEGNGLGLYIAKYIVEAYDGIITAENDNGLKIIISLPKVTEGVQ
ncbi:HAMP domain-containing histidine kinase [Desulfosporosinus fructosivorans]|uniref:histidine kinase n=1 Tax=Desulfosporosinus fructosivorans TaxID=2018669 RepID=A0A4Z0QZU6_9FIRM|nr:HAMP domain-containing sensor histidine kinase [Desulfosporosinus fructosivorans]TGE35595.1 HAMP domain-containing histidine kinase [Desulfosporosinus fructosivorans]